MLTFAQYICMTMLMLTSDGIAAHLPTLVVSDDHLVNVLEGIPAEVDQREALQDWIIGCGVPSSFLFGVRSGLNEVTIGRCTSPKCEFVSIAEHDGRFETSSVAAPLWWHIERH